MSGNASVNEPDTATRNRSGSHESEGNGGGLNTVAVLLKIAALGLIVWILIVVVRWVSTVTRATSITSDESAATHACHACGTEFACRERKRRRRSRMHQLHRRNVNIQSVPFEVIEPGMCGKCCGTQIAAQHQYFCNYSCYLSLQSALSASPEPIDTSKTLLSLNRNTTSIPKDSRLLRHKHSLPK